jgi:RimJ/RimL family protein N-acetyltransferase
LISTLDKPPRAPVGWRIEFLSRRCVLSVESLTLRREVFREDVDRMLEWMKDRRVTGHLNEDQNIDRRLEEVLHRSGLPLFTPVFNRDGAFFVICHQELGPIGFLRLVSHPSCAEMVVVIGERSLWGRGYGCEAIRKGLRHAFFERREDKVVAKIHKENKRSEHVFLKAGFHAARELENRKEVEYALPLESYLH